MVEEKEYMAACPICMKNKKISPLYADETGDGEMPEFVLCKVHGKLKTSEIYSK